MENYLIVLFKNILNVTQNEGLLKTIGLVLMNTGPFLLMFGVIVFILYLLIFYKNTIIEEHVSQGFSSFSNILIILSLIQVYIVILKEEIYFIAATTKHG